MDMLMLAGALIATLGGVMALAFRVVRLPQGLRTGPANKQVVKMNPREPAQVLLVHMTDEYKRHTVALREALDLRRARNEAEAMTRLLNERILHAEAARMLARFVQPTIGGRVLQWVEQTRLNVVADAVRREVAEARIPAPSQPLTREGAFVRFTQWARGGPRTGAPEALVLYHRAQREHYRMEMARARRIVAKRRTADALPRLAAEQTYHLRAMRDLKRQTQPGDGPDGAGATDPTLTAILI